MEKQMLEGKVAIITGASYGMGQTMIDETDDDWMLHVMRTALKLL